MCLEAINQSINESVSIQEIIKKSPSNFSKFTSASYDNPPIFQSIYPILDKLNINITTSKLDDKPLDVIF